jgi:hypothetical protein
VDPTARGESLSVEEYARLAAVSEPPTVDPERT